MEFIKGRLKSIHFAISGMIYLLRTEHSIISQVCIAFIFICLGWYFRISKIEWIIQISLIGFILSIESLNTAIEKLCDFVHPDFHEKIGNIKDVAAGAVSFAVIFALIISIIIYYPYII